MRKTFNSEHGHQKNSIFGVWEEKSLQHHLFYQPFFSINILVLDQHSFTFFLQSKAFFIFFYFYHVLISHHFIAYIL